MSAKYYELAREWVSRWRRLWRLEYGEVMAESDRLQEMVRGLRMKAEAITEELLIELLVNRIK